VVLFLQEAKMNKIMRAEINRVYILGLIFELLK